MKAGYLSAIVVLLVLLVGTGWYALSLQKQVEDLSAQNQELQNALNDLQQVVNSLQQQVSQLQGEKQKLAQELDEIGVKVDLLLDFGNGTRLWFNDTLLPYGSSLLNATLAKARPVKYTVYESGTFVDEIMGVQNSNPWFWLWWKYEDGKWVMGETGADAAILKDGGIYAWKYSDTSSWPPEPP